MSTDEMAQPRGIHVDFHVSAIDDTALAIGKDITDQAFKTFANGKVRTAHLCRTRSERLSTVAARIGRETLYYDMIEDYRGGW